MKPLLVAFVVVTVALTGPAFADERGKDARKAYEEAQKEYWKDRREAEKEYDKERREAHKEYWKDRREAQKEYDKERREAYKESRKYEREAYRRWARGEHLPADYLLERYLVRDYRAYDLAPPPDGYGWVRPYEDDGTYYMVQLATGLISQILDH